MRHDLSDVSSISVRRPVLAVVVNLLLIVAGLAALGGVEVRELPNVDRPVVTKSERKLLEQREWARQFYSNYEG